MKLTPRETKVLEQMFMLVSVKEIAHSLKLSPTTVRYHQKSIYRKAGIHGEGSKLMLLLRRYGRFEVTVRWVPK